MPLELFTQFQENVATRLGFTLKKMSIGSYDPIGIEIRGAH